MNREKLEIWLLEQTRETCIEIAVRASLRSLPILTYDERFQEEGKHQILAIMRAILTAAVASNQPSQEFIGISANTAKAVDDMVSHYLTTSGEAYLLESGDRLSLRSEFSDVFRSVHYCALTVSSKVFHLDSLNAVVLSKASTKELFQEVERDFRINAEKLFSVPLWMTGIRSPFDSGIPGHIAEQFPSKQNLLTVDLVWSFWRDWYQGFLDGKPLDWELQRRVALIPDADWEKGPEHIAGLIEQIREPFVLRERIAELETLLPERATSRLGIGGNNPPERIDDIKTPQQAITAIWTALDDLKEESNAEHPNREKIKAAIAWINAVASTCAKWAGGHLDAGIREAAKAAGKTAGIATTGTLAMNWPEVQSAIGKVIESASKWLSYFN